MRQRYLPEPVTNRTRRPDHPVLRAVGIALLMAGLFVGAAIFNAIAPHLP